MDGMLERWSRAVDAGIDANFESSIWSRWRKFTQYVVGSPNEIVGFLDVL